MSHRGVIAEKRYWIESLEPRTLLSVTSLAITGAQGAVFDNARNLIYFPTASGAVQRYNVATQSFLTPWSVPGSLGPGDITSDGSALFVTDRKTYGANAEVHKIDLATGQVTDIVYPRLMYEGGSWDLIIGSDANAYVTAEAGTSATSYSAAIINTSTNAVSRSSVLNLEYRTMLSRSEDRNWIGIGYTDAGLETYSIATGKVIAKGDETNTVGGSYIPAVNANGTLFATPTRAAGLQIVTQDLKAVRNIAATNSSFAFDPVKSRFYVAAAGALTAYDTTNWNALYTIGGVTAAGQEMLGSMSLNAAGTKALVISSDTNTVQLVDLPVSDGVAALATISNLTSYGVSARAQSFTVTVKDAAGNVATGYRGTVQITSSDVRATLPAAYTFTAADAGVHTFTATFRTNGAQQVQAADSSGQFTASSSIVVHALNARLQLPFASQGMLYDPTRNLLYFLTSAGNIERYDPSTQQLLNPIVIGNPLVSMDITADGSRLFVGNGYRSVTQGWIDEVDLSTGTFKQDTYDFTGFSELQGGSYDVVIPSSNVVLFSSDFNGSGNVPLRQLDLSTGAISTRTDYRHGSIQMRTSFVRGGDRSIVFIAEPNSSAYPYGVYDALTNTFPIQRQDFKPYYVGSINRNGTLLSSSTGIVDRLLQPVDSKGVTGGLFDPTRDLLYQFANTTVSIYDTNSWSLLSQFPITAPASSGALFSDDGKWLFVPSTSEIAVYPLITRPVITSSATSVAPGGSQAVTVIAQKPDGSTDASYRGSIHFTSTDAAAGLPTDYAFTAADAGQHTFNIPLNTPGRQTITVTDTTTGMTSALYEIMVTGQSLSAEGALYVIGGPGADTVNLSTAGGILTATLNATTQTYNASQIKRVEVLTQGGNDNIVVGSGGIPGGTVEAGAGFDTINATAGDDVTRTLNVDGGDDADQAIFNPTGLQQLNFTGGAGSDSFNYTAGGGNDTITVTPGVVLNGSRTATFAAEAVSIAGGAGDDIISGDKLITPTLYTFDGGEGNDTLTSAHGGGTIGNPVRVSLLGGNGNDAFDMPAIENKSATNYASVIGGAGTDVLRAVGSGIFNSSAISNNENSYSYTSIEQMNVTGTSQADNFSISLGISSTIALIVNGGDGADSFGFGANPYTTQPTINGEGGNDTFTVSSATTGSILFDGGADSDSIIFNSSATTSKYTVNATQVRDTAASSRLVFDSNVEAISISSGTGSDIFDITPRANTTITLNGNSPTPPTSPGDQLNITAGGATDMTLVPGATGAGQVTSSNRQTVTYSGIETVPDVFPPHVSAARFDPPSSTSMAIAVTFSEDVGATVNQSSLQLKNAATNQPVSIANATFSYSSPTATWSFPANALLPDATYSATVLASGIHDSVPNAMPADYTFSFVVLGGDGDGNQTVGIEDFNLLAQNFGKLNQTFTQGNYDYSADGKVDILDFNILAANFGKHLDAAQRTQSVSSISFAQPASISSLGSPARDDIAADIGLLGNDALI